MYDDFVELLPEEFVSFVPPEPISQFKYSADAEGELYIVTGALYSM